MNKGILTLAALALSACATTSFNTSWRAPDAGPLTFERGDKILAMVISPNESTRRGGETALAAELTKRGLDGVLAYNVIPSDVIRDNDKAKQLVTESGAVGVVTMRVMDEKQEVYSTPATSAAPHYGGFWGGYYGWGWGTVYRPGYIPADTIVSIETRVYDLGQNKLVWAGHSGTVNPSQAARLIKDVVDESVKEMRKQGLIG